MAEQNVVDLVDPHVPADQGLSSLGLLMQLGGNVFAALAALVSFNLLFVRVDRVMLWLLLVLGTSIARSFLQRAAGTQLLYGGTGNRLHGVHRYVAFALAHSVLVGALLATKLHSPLMLALAIAAGLAVWPLALGVLVRLPRFRRFNDDVPVSEDKGFEGASILMTVLGLCGAVGGGTALFAMVAASVGPGVLLVLTMAMLVLRSIIHVQAGVSGLRETNVDRSVELASRYASFGVISAFCGGGAFLLDSMATLVNVGSMVAITGIVWMLMTWPLVVRRFFADRQFVDLLAGDAAPVHRRAPDAGLTALGWLLLAGAMIHASIALPGLVMAHDMGEFADLAAFFGTRSIWWSIGVIVLQAWAGYELIRMSPQSRTIATVFGVVGTAVALYTNWPLLDGFEHTRFFSPMAALTIGPLALALIIPVATLVLVNRKIAPTARARFRQKSST